jgi:SAM-dependent methyltransferase
MADFASGPAGFGRSADAYEQQMGRWSRRLAPQLIRFGGLSDQERVLDVGCGTGSLAFSLPEIADVAVVTGVDQAEVYVVHARRQTADLRFTFEQADARALPFPDNSFDRAFSLLVLQFIAEPARAVAEMQRVVRPGGTVTAAVWDSYGGLPHTRLVWDIALVLDPAFTPPMLRPLTAPGGMATIWRDAGLLDVEQTSLMIRVDFANFDDYWLPLSSEGPVAQFLDGLSPPARQNLTKQVKRAYLANQPDGPRSFACVAWACRGAVAD